MKYKGKTLSTKQWITGYLFYCGNQPYIGKEGNVNGELHGEPVLEETICRELGMVDNANVDIFENDIVKMYDTLNGRRFVNFATFRYNPNNLSFILTGWNIQETDKVSEIEQNPSRITEYANKDLSVIGNRFDLDILTSGGTAV